MSAAAAAAPAEPGTSNKPIPEGYKVVREGLAEILSKGDNEVFYNKAQVVNRDISKLVLNWYIKKSKEEMKDKKLRRKRQKERTEFLTATPTAEDKAVKGVRFLEGLAASGLRSIRFAKEVKGLGRIDACDIEESAFEAMKVNIDHNGVGSTVKPHLGDARMMMLQKAGLFDVVDLDPYGTPVQLLDSAVQAVKEGGMLMVTATDMAVLCGNNGETCYTKYGSYPLHKPYCHEMALRILLHCIQSHAVRYKRHIVPVASLSIDFYVRVFVRVYTSAQEVKNAATQSMYVWQSSGCDSFWQQPVGQRVQKKGQMKYQPTRGPAVPSECPDTGSGFSMGGPLWSDPIHDRETIAALLEHLEETKGDYPAYGRIRALLVNAAEELPDVPLYYSIHELAKTMRSTPPKMEIMRSALLNAGFRVSGSHANPLAVKTDAPPTTVWDIMRCWIKKHPIKKPDPDSYLGKLVAKEPTLQADFSRVAAAVHKGKADKIVRFPAKPDNWGPRPRAGRPNLPHEQDAAQAPEKPEEAAQKPNEAGSKPEGAEAAAKPDVAGMQSPADANGTNPNKAAEKPAEGAGGGEANLSESEPPAKRAKTGD